MSLKYKILISLSVMAIFYGCSPKKNTRYTRAYHELTTRYNVFFNAQDSYNETLNSIYENHKDNWHSLLPLYPNSRDANDTIQKSVGGPFDRVVDKTTKAIQEHSISSKPKRERDKMNSQQYRDWLRQNEFNPFIDQAWLLMGKAHVQNGDYMDAISVFANTIRLFSYDIDVVSESQIWLVRAYSEIGWYTDAEVLIEVLKARDLSQQLEADFLGAHTHLLIKQEKYKDAIPILSEAISTEKNSVQRRRMQFLLGQLYSQLGNNSKAYDSFEKVKGISTPYDASLNAMIAQSKVASDNKRIVDDLRKQSRRANNDNYKDQIFGAIGDYYYLSGDTINAVDNYLKAELNSISNGVYKSLTQEKLGWIYYNRKDYISSGRRYLEAVGQFPKDHTKYKEVLHRAEVLSELMPHLVALHVQDSLQHLANLPYDEQMKIVNAHIAHLKRLERDESTRAFVEQLQSSAPSAGLPMPAQPNQVATFYFYNPQLVSQGINDFKKRWGNRRLEDNWRISNSTTMPDYVYDTSIEQSANTETYSNELVIFSPEYWLQQLPTSPEAISASNSIIGASLYEIGNIAKNRLYDFELAINSYSRLYKDFAESQFMLDAAYNLYMIYRQANDYNNANIYRSKIISSFPDSDYVVMMTDPEYESIMANYAFMENALYQEAYQAYQNGNVMIVHSSYNKANRLFASSTLMPKFSLLHSLAYAMSGDIDSLQVGLEKFVSKYKESDETELALNILTGLKEGRELVANASVMSDMDWITDIASSSSRRYSEDYIAEFDDNRTQPHTLLLIFDDEMQSRNELLFAVANHNFSTYQLRAFSTSFMEIGDVNALRIMSFGSFDEARLYSDRLSSDSYFKENISDSLNTIVIADTNLNLLLSSKSIDQYKEYIDDADDSIASEKRDTIIDLIINDSEEGIYTLPPIEINIKNELGEENEPTLDIQIPIETPVSIEEKLQDLERRQQQAISQSEQPVSEKERRKQLRDRENERKKIIKDRQIELKQKEKARNEELKRRERGRQQKIKEQEKIRKAKLDERARLLRQQNR